jgi:hypothetical protein
MRFALLLVILAGAAGCEDFSQYRRERHCVAGVRP